MMEDLLLSARKLPAVPARAAEDYSRKAGALAERVNAAMESRADLAVLIGRNAVELMRADHENHAAFMANVLRLNAFELHARTCVWSYRACRGHGFSYDYFPIAFDCWRRAVESELAPGQAEPIAGIYRWMIDRHAMFIAAAGEAPSSEPSLDPRWAQARRLLLARLLEGDSAEALLLGRSIVQKEADLEGFFLEVLQPVMKEIGSRWERGQTSVAEEHLASAVAGRMITVLYTDFVVQKSSRGTIVVTSAPNEFHELGAWMVSDLLELDGWRVKYLGANTPTQDLIALLARERPAALCVSVTMSFNLERARALISAVRARPELNSVRIVVGGLPFQEQPDLGQAIGADETFLDAREGVRRLRRLGPDPSKDDERP